MKLRYYAPRGIDEQTPHDQDEVYIIIAGQGRFQNGDEHHPFQPGDVIFVPAGQEHRFFDFSDDFATWVIFYGAEGDEAA
jgi:mannose-6-phosphate isomerase-like protein (cupin superfamily)